MPQPGARVESIDAIRQFRVALIKFAESGNVALTSADSDIDRTLSWLEREQTVYWANQVRKRHEMVQRCEDAVRQKRIFKGFDGREQSAVDELKALSNARRMREEAEQKVIAVKKAIQVLQKEAQMYRGRVQNLATTLQQDIPNAVRMLDAMAMQLDNYVSIQTEGEGLPFAEAAASIAQAAGTRKAGYERLRDATPDAEQRKAAPPKNLSADDPFFGSWATGVVEPWQHEALQKLTIEREPIDPDHRLIVARGCWLQPRIYLERQRPAFDGDTGWFLGPVDQIEKKPEYDALRAGDLIAARPDLVDILSMPTGFLVVLDNGGPAAILDLEGLDVWAVALMSATPPEPAPTETSAEAEATAAGDQPQRQP
jgi:hypothetical protein